METLSNIKEFGFLNLKLLYDPGNFFYIMSVLLAGVLPLSPNSRGGVKNKRVSKHTKCLYVS